jgi:hypothetical protein
MAEWPTSFTDALELTKRLGGRYLRTDARSIAQNDAEDWRREAAMMIVVYENAFCNLGAHAAADRPLGLFPERDPRTPAIQTLPVRRKNADRPFYAYPQTEPNRLAAFTAASDGCSMSAATGLISGHHTI